MKLRSTTLALFSVVAVVACDPFGPVPDDQIADVDFVAPQSLKIELRHDDSVGGGGNGGGGSNVAAELQEAKAVVHAVAAHVAGGGWQTIMEGRVTVDFLRLADHAEELGIASLPAGKITQIRLYILEDEEAYVIDGNGDQFPLKTPSGVESGIKVKGNWDLGECQAGTLVLTTNGKKAIHIHGRGANADYIMRPVIRAGRYEAVDADCGGPNVGEGEGEGEPGVGEGEGEGETGGEGEGEGGEGEGEPGLDGTDPNGGEEGCFDPETGTISVDNCEGGEGGSGGDDPSLGGADGSGGGDGSDDPNLGGADGSGGGGDGSDDPNLGGADGSGGGDGSDDPNLGGADGSGGGGDGTGGDGTGADGSGTYPGETDGSGTGGDGTGGDGTGSYPGETDGSGGGGGGGGDAPELCFAPEVGFYDC